MKIKQTRKSYDEMIRRRQKKWDEQVKVLQAKRSAGNITEAEQDRLDDYLISRRPTAM